MTSKLTFYVMAYQEPESFYYEFNYDLAIDWAYDMLLEGYDTPHLAMLAGMDKPINYFEIKEYIAHALRELDIPMLSVAEAKLSLYTYHVLNISEGIDIWDNIRKLDAFADDDCFTLGTYDFKLLEWAWPGDEPHEPYPNHYYPGATPDNIDQLAIDTAKEWLESLPTKFSSDS